MHAGFVVIGGGLSGLAAAIRLARFHEDVLLLERHARIGGLNSYYYRNNRLFETGMHAITNFAEKEAKHTPFNKLLRQLKINREEIGLHQQRGSEIRFPDTNLLFSNDFELLKEEIESKFPHEAHGFAKLVCFLDSFDPFRPQPYRSTRKMLLSFVRDPLFIDMLLCPMFYYGSSWENDVDLNQFVILFRSIFQEGLFRPDGTIKDLLDLLVNRLKTLGGTIRLNSGVTRIITDGDRVSGLELDNGEEISCDHLVSTIGLDETRSILGDSVDPVQARRLSFIETIFQVDKAARPRIPINKTCIFYNTRPHLQFAQPATPIDCTSGVVTLPNNFENVPPGEDETFEIRSTHLANYSLWREAGATPSDYNRLKSACVEASCRRTETIVGTFADDIVFTDSFTPVTIERFTGKREGAIYGSPEKAATGDIGYDNLVLAGTDQGFLGIVGSMMSGVTMVNQRILTKL